MSEDEYDPTGPKTLPPTRVATPLSDIPIRESHPDIKANAPQWLAEMHQRFDEVIAQERERADQAHRAAQKIASAYLKCASELKLNRATTEGLRADVQKLHVRLGDEMRGKIAESEQSMRAYVDEQMRVHLEEYHPAKP